MISGSVRRPRAVSHHDASAPLKVAILRNPTPWGRFLLSGRGQYPIQTLELPRTALGLSNPLLNGWTARCGPHILDPMVGEPATYVQGFPA